MKVVLRRLAENELAAAVAWYNLQKTDLGKQLTAAVDQSLQEIADHPERWPLHHKSVRRAVVDRFPFLRYYEIHHASIKVLRIVHASRDPTPILDLL